MTKETLELFLQLLSQVQVKATDENADELWEKLKKARDELRAALTPEKKPKE